MTFLQQKKTVLLLEANAETRKHLLKVIAKKGCYIISVKNIQEAEHTVAGPVDIAILDGDTLGNDVEHFRAKLHAVNPAARILVNTTMPDMFAKMKGVEVFEKPKEVKALEAALHDCH